MPPVLDREDFVLLIKEEKDFIVCASKSEDIPEVFEEVFRKYANKVFVLICTPKTCPRLYKHLKLGKSGAILLFWKGNLVDIIHNFEKRDILWNKIDQFLDFVNSGEIFILRECMFKRNRRKLKYFIEIFFSNTNRRKLS